ncbi:MAG: GNAT family N-acetyltransferase [Bacteroidota bacterium]
MTTFNKSTTEASLLIRNARQEDLIHIHQVDRDAFGQLAYPAFVLRQFFDCSAQLFKVAVDEDSIVGYVLGQQKQDSSSAYVLSLATAESHRGQGIAYQLMEQLEAEGRALGLSSWVLTVAPDNRSALQLYLKRGYAIQGDELDYYGDGHRRYIMEKTLR